MNKTKSLKYTLFCAAALGGLMLGHPAEAQTDAQIQAIQQQIKELQSQLDQVKADLAARDRALKAAQQQAKAAQDQAAAAPAQAARASPLSRRAGGRSSRPPRLRRATAAQGAVQGRRPDRHPGRVRGA